MLVTIVALLIWLYAEGENVKDYAMSLEVQFVPTAGRELSIKPNRLSEPVTAVFRCNSSQQNQLRSLLESGPVNIELYDSPDPRQEIYLRERLTALPLITNMGIGVIDVSPAKVPVTVERIESRKLPITVRAAGQNLITDITIEPAEASIRLPASQLVNIAESATVEARLLPDQLEGLELNQQHVISNVPLAPPDTVRGSDITVSPATARVSFIIRTLTKDLTLPSVAVRIVAPIAKLANYEVSLVSPDDQLLRDVHLKGPNEVIDKIESHEIKIWADLKLEADDLDKNAGKESMSVVPEINRPASVTVVVPPAPIKLKITPRS
ncbi:MAG: hypothetical protein IT440_02455 [Phycisphaeraceae bacterium]|nr:hypothetical protein [Phycisphaeraceae bacterium]